MAKLEGIFPILNTTYHEDGSLDLKCQARLVNYLLEFLGPIFLRPGVVVLSFLAAEILGGKTRIHDCRDGHAGLDAVSVG